MKNIILFLVIASQSFCLYLSKRELEFPILELEIKMNRWLKEGQISYASTAYGCNCNCSKKIVAELVLTNDTCPYCHTKNDSKVENFKTHLLLSAIQRGENDRRDRLIKKGIKITSDCLTYKLVLKFIKQNPHIILQHNINHADLLKSMKSHRIPIDFSILPAENKLKPSELLYMISLDYTWVGKDMSKYLEHYSEEEKAEMCSGLMDLYMHKNIDFFNFRCIILFFKKYGIEYRSNPFIHKLIPIFFAKGKAHLPNLIEIDPYLANNPEIKKFADIDDLIFFTKFFKAESLEEFPEAFRVLEASILENQSPYFYDQKLNILKNSGLPFPKDTKGNTLQIRAAMLDQIELLKRIPKDQSVNREGLSSLSWSILTNSKQAFKHILPDSNIEEFDNNGRTPLMLSLQANNFYMTYQLLKNGANVKARDFDGNNCDDYVKTKSKSIKAIFKLMTLKRNICEKVKDIKTYF